MTTPLTFADRLRELRLKAQRTMGEVARALNITTVYYSDVENKRKHPFPTEKIDYARLAAEVKGDQHELETLAIAQRGRLGIALKPANAMTQDMAIRMARCINENLLPDDAVDEINKILERRGIK